MKRILIEQEFGARPSIAEMEVVDILIVNKIPKKSVKFLKPNRSKGSKTPDLLVDGMMYWEIKSIEKLGKYTLDHAERAGLKQADNLIFDLRKLSIVLEKKALAHIEKNFAITKAWRRAIVIVRPNGRCLTFEK